MRLPRVALLSCVALLMCGCVAAATAQERPFHTLRLTDAFYGEGATVGDFDKDGHADVVSGPFLYLGPDFVTRREIAPPVSSDPHGYSKSFLQFTADLNADGWPDVVEIGFPGEATVWYENPAGERSPLVGNTRGHWSKHVGLAVTDNESPGWADVTGDGVPELIAQTGGRFGYAVPDPANPTQPWTFHPVTPQTDRGRFTHGLGVGDVNGDGRADFLENGGWWEQPAVLTGDPDWTFHPAKFADAAAQMYVADLDGDGLGDVVTSLNGHGYGVAWYQQTAGGEFNKHIIMGDRGHDNPGGVVFTQPHALALADMDGDGVTDIVTGKRFWAHGPHGDAEPEGIPVLYYFRTVGNKNTDPPTHFEPVLIDDASGIGTQVTVADVNADGKPDVVVGNKLGTFISIQR